MDNAAVKPRTRYTALRYASVVSPVVVCLSVSVRYTPALYRNGWTDRADIFGTEASFISYIVLSEYFGNS